MDLKQRFFSIINSSDLGIDLWNEIEQKYTEKHRAYHNLTHVEELFRYFDRYIERLHSPSNIAFAIYYHDIIYAIDANDNEERSAQLAANRLSDLGLSKETIQEIEQLILVTKSHAAQSNDEQYMVDFDLTILGQEPSIYQAYQKQIREEYKQVPWVIYKNGRKKVLKQFLKKKTIYCTKEFQENYEKQARQNLKHELKKL